MVADTLTALSQRNEAFWIGLGLLFTGALVSSFVQISNPPVGEILGILGVTVLAVRLLVGLYKILRTSAKAGRTGYQESKQDN
ncbi:hypothetical protein BDK88_0075 [Natrinema hispanicum]|uniref:Uncharacterized protein n=1 Tax=Natrinema hispanicum TaxID=392421 RepID=A0A482YE75_9EURY|nr:hypothetical protein BDK88_0075 [Natrinema hispanicum]